MNTEEERQPDTFSEAPAKKEENHESDSKRRLREFLETILELVIVAALVLLFIRFVAFRSVVQGSSMNATLNNRDNLIVERVSYYFHDPERFDIVVFRNPDESDEKEHFIKRVIGLPGEMLEIRNGIVYIDGEALTEDVYGLELMYSDHLSKTDPLNYGPVAIPQGEFFVLGDNRNNSKDSRYPEVGTVPKKLILGRVLVRFWPLNAIRGFNGQ